MPQVNETFWSSMIFTFGFFFFFTFLFINFFFNVYFAKKANLVLFKFSEF